MNVAFSPHELRRLLVVKGIRPEELAFKAGVSPQTVTRILSGKGCARWGTAMALAQVLKNLPDVVDGSLLEVSRVGR